MIYDMNVRSDVDPFQQHEIGFLAWTHTSAQAGAAADDSQRGYLLLMGVGRCIAMAVWHGLFNR